VCTGDSDVIGSWKIIAISLPRMPQISGPTATGRVGEKQEDYLV
jgi:hypothetical protein